MFYVRDGSCIEELADQFILLQSPLAFTNALLGPISLPSLKQKDVGPLFDNLLDDRGRVKPQLAPFPSFNSTTPSVRTSRDKKK